VRSGVQISGDVYNPAVGAEYAEAVIELLKSPPNAKARRKIQQAAPIQSWMEVAEEWLQLITETGS
jgi:hypothetical protein